MWPSWIGVINLEGWLNDSGPILQTLLANKTL